MLIADGTAAVNLSVWDQLAGEIHSGDLLLLKGGFVTEILLAYVGAVLNSNFTGIPLSIRACYLCTLEEGEV